MSPLASGTPARRFAELRRAAVSLDAALLASRPAAGAAAIHGGLLLRPHQHQGGGVASGSEVRALKCYLCPSRLPPLVLTPPGTAASPVGGPQHSPAPLTAARCPSQISAGAAIESFDGVLFGEISRLDRFVGVQVSCVLLHVELRWASRVSPRRFFL